MEQHWPDLGPNIENVEILFASNGVFMTEFGDDDGIRQWNLLQRRPDFGVRNSCLPAKKVLDWTTGQCWELSGSFTHMGVAPAQHLKTFIDVRTLGLFGRPIQQKSPSQMLSDLAAPLKDPKAFAIKEEGGRTIVILSFPHTPPDPGLEYSWSIDKGRNFAVLEASETAVFDNGKRELLSRATCDYQKPGNRWWPARVDTVCPQSGWTCSVVFHRVEFDSPEHPTSVQPELMGAPPGVRVYGVIVSGDSASRKGRYAGKGTVISEAEFLASKNQFDLAALDAFNQSQAALGSGTFPVWWQDDTDFGLSEVRFLPDQWELYVRRWILKRVKTEFHPVAHPLEERQINTAWAILKECRERAQPVRRRVDEELIRLRALSISGTLQKGETRAGAATSKPSMATREAKKRIDELCAPAEISAIFAELQERLEGLLSTSQRKADLTTKPSESFRAKLKQNFRPEQRSGHTPHQSLRSERSKTGN
jgi:hypothetical protein